MRNFMFLVWVLISSTSQLIGQEILLLKSSGKVVIGDTSQIMTPGNYNLYVQNGILTERVKVALKDASEWSDDAFDRTPSIQEVEMSILEKKHLYDMPSVDDLLKNGYELKEMDALLLKQIEWLWQHLIDMSNQNKELLKELEELKSGTTGQSHKNP